MVVARTPPRPSASKVLSACCYLVFYEVSYRILSVYSNFLHRDEGKEHKTSAATQCVFSYVCSIRLALLTLAGGSLFAAITVLLNTDRILPHLFFFM